METKEIVKALRCCYCHNLTDCEDCEYNELGGFCVESLKRDAAKRLEELEAEIAKLKQQLSTKQPEWISVEDEPPTEPGRILINRKNSTRVNTYSYQGNKKELKNFAYWMPMPKAPEPPKPKEPTFKDVLLEKFPKAIMYNDGIPLSCRASIFGGKCSLGSTKCFECWNQSYFEEEEKE